MDGLGFKAPNTSKRNPQHPPLYFKGSSRGSDSGTTLSVIKGCVYEEEDGSVRWRFVRVRGSFPFHVYTSHLIFVGINLRQHPTVEVSVRSIVLWGACSQQSLLARAGCRLETLAVPLESPEFGRRRRTIKAIQSVCSLWAAKLQSLTVACSGPFWLFKNENNARTPVMDYN